MTETVQSAIAAKLDALQIPSLIDTDTYPSIVALFEEAFATYRDEAACSSVGHTLTYADLDRLSAQFAGWLQHGAGLEPVLLYLKVQNCHLLRWVVFD